MTLKVMPKVRIGTNEVARALQVASTVGVGDVKADKRPCHPADRLGEEIVNEASNL